MTSHDALGVGHRLSSGPSDIAARTAFAHELLAAPHLWDGLALADLAHALALDAAGLLPPDARRPLFDALLETLEIRLDDVDLDPAVGDVYNNRDRLLRSLAGPAAGHVHTGRARREASTIAWQLACRRKLLELGIATSALLDQLATTAESHVTTVMPDFTYLHRAHPTTLAHYLLGHAAPIGRHLDRIATAIALVDSSPAGSGSTNGSRLPIDRILLAELLGFGSVIQHTRDAMWAPDMVVDLVNVCVQIMTSADRLAEELQLFTTEAFDFVEIGDDQSRTSVVMPHKKNPYALTYIRGAARNALGTATGVTATLLTPSGQPDNRTFAYLHVPTLLDDTTGVVELLSAVLDGATFNVDHMRSAASSGFTTSTEICDHLSLTTDLDNRTSHSIVGAAVKRAVDAHRTYLELDDLTRAAAAEGVDIALSSEQLDALVDPDAALAARVTPGGAGADEVHSMIETQRRQSRQKRTEFADHPSVGFEGRLIVRARSAAAATTPTERKPPT